jgi:xanthine dehydrogenase FAD-binding subunit
MPIAHEFEYAKPDTLEEAIGILAARGEGACVLAGGTDLVGWMRDDLVAPAILVDIKGIAGLDGLALENGRLTIGALATFTDLIDSDTVRKNVPLAFEMAKTVASMGIRNRATVAGNICSAVPCCDAGPVLLAYEAEIRVTGPDGERAVPVTEWFRGNKVTARRAGEIVTSLVIEVPAEDHGGAYVKLGRYRGEDLAQASVAVLALPGNRYRVAFGAVAATPVRAPAIEALLKGKTLDESLIAAAQKLVAEETSPITDIRASKEYRALMLPVMLERGLGAAVSRLEGRGPEYGTRFV